MSVKQTRVSLKGLSEEEKKERKRVMMREYMKKRRETDPEFYTKHKQYVKENKLKLRTNEEYLAKEKEYNKNYYKNIKTQLQIFRESIAEK